MLDEVTNMNINFNPLGFIETLPYMGKGMLSIFGVIGIIIVMTMLLNMIKAPGKKDKDQK